MLPPWLTANNNVFNEQPKCNSSFLDVLLSQFQVFLMLQFLDCIYSALTPEQLTEKDIYL